MGKFENSCCKSCVALQTPISPLTIYANCFGFEERTRGSHHIFRKQGIEEKLNLQREGSKAKVYQVRQVRAVILKHKLGAVD